MKYLVEIKFKGPFHFGADDAGIGVETIRPFFHSDTLFSAFINTWASIEYMIKAPRLDDFFQCFKKGESPLIFSSMGFVRITGKGHEYYLPKPLALPSELKAVLKRKPLYTKAIKNVDFIRLTDFKDWQQGLYKQKPEPLLKSIIDAKQEFVVEEFKIQHQTDKLTLASQIYRTGICFLKEDVKAFFVVNLDESVLSLDTFKLIFDTMTFNGLGGRRTCGVGAFEYDLPLCLDKERTTLEKEFENYPEEKEIGRQLFSEILNFKCGDSFYLFSLYSPQIKNLPPPHAYALVLRKGWIFSTSSQQQLKRNSCYMLGEGSILKNDPVGQLVDVTPDEFSDQHAIYRSGMAFPIPFKI